MNTDVVGKYIRLREENADIDEQIKALEVIILSQYRNDDRIKIFAGRKTITLSDSIFEKLESAGVITTVMETRKKKLEEFDVEVQRLILGNPDNYTEKISKESIRINNEKA